MDQNIVDRRLVLGGKALAQTTPQAITEQPLASASTTTMFANVRDFGATGNGRTDDTVAIRAAVNWGSRLNRGDIYFPVGKYRITGPIFFGRHRNVSINFIGAPGAMIFGSFRGYLLNGLTIDGRSGTHSVENLTMRNGHLRGGAVAFRDCAGGRLSNCVVSAWQGILADKALSLLVDTCTIVARDADSSSVGISARNDTSVTCTTVAGYNVGLQHYLAGLTVLGGQFKSNTYGLALARSEGFHIAGLSMWRNRVGINVREGVGGIISSVSINGNLSMAHGLRLDSCEAVTVQAVTVTGNKGYGGGGITIERSRRIVVIGTESASNRKWLVNGPRQHLNFIQTNYQ